MSLEISMQMDFAKTERALGAYARQLPFATARAINATAKDFQRFQRMHMENVFTVRRKSFVRRAVKIKPFARKTSLEAIVSIDLPGGRSDILAKFEVGGRKTARDGGSVAVPIAVRKTKAGIVSRRQRPRSFNFRRVGRSWRGDRRTFLIPRTGIFQRHGPRGASSIRLLYRFASGVNIPRTLRFVANARKVVPKVFPGHFRTALRDAIRTAR